MFKYFIFSFLFQIVAAGCQSGCVQYNSYCLCFHLIPESFEVAKINCLNLGGNLATIQNLKTNEFIFQQSIIKNLKTDLWIDNTPQQVSQRFYKHSQKNAEFSNWNFQQKNIILSSNICATLSISNGLWEIESCKTLKSYICTFSTSSSAASADDEIPATTTIPTITTQSSDDDDVTTDGCLDEISSCQQYLNECSDPDYQPMLYKFCRKTCNLCGQCMDSNPQCPQLAAGGFCTNPEDKWTECSKTCKLC